MNNNLEKIVNGYETEHEVDVFKIKDGKYYIYLFNSKRLKYKEFSKNEFIDQLINWMVLDLKELKIISKKEDDQKDYSKTIKKLEKDIKILKKNKSTDVIVESKERLWKK